MDITLNGNKLTIEEIMEIGSDGVNIKLSNDSIDRMRGSRDHVARILDSGTTVYGINTGFGSLSNVSIEPPELKLSLIHI